MINWPKFVSKVWHLDVDVRSDVPMDDDGIAVGSKLRNWRLSWMLCCRNKRHKIGVQKWLTGDSGMHGEAVLERDGMRSCCHSVGCGRTK